MDWKNILIGFILGVIFQIFFASVVTPFFRKIKKWTKKNKKFLSRMFILISSLAVVALLVYLITILDSPNVTKTGK